MHKFGASLINMKYNVVGVDSNPDNIRRAQRVFSQVYGADASHKQALEQAGFADISHVLVSVGDSACRQN